MVETPGPAELVEPLVPPPAGNSPGQRPRPAMTVRELPGDAILLHLGVHKTGTTALQAAFAAARPELASAGVLYPGNRPAHHGPAMAVLGRSWGWAAAGGQHTRGAVFDKLAKQARRAPGRVFISSEQFCEADDEQAARVVDGLGAGRLHVLLTLRPLAELLPSSYQQYLKYGLKLRYGKWLENTLADDGRKPASPSFWRRNDHAAVVNRWATLLGADRVHVLVLDPADREVVPRSVAALLGLPPALLTTRMGLRTNRSLTAAEAELVRQLNQRLRPSLNWADYERLVREGVVADILARRPGPGEPPLRTPGRARRTAADRGAKDAAAIAASGVSVVGDLRRLAGTSSAQPDQAQPDQARPDLSRPDLSQPELARPELARPDLARPELALPGSAKSASPGQQPPANCLPTEAAVAAIAGLILAPPAAPHRARKMLGRVRSLRP